MCRYVICSFRHLIFFSYCHSSVKLLLVRLHVDTTLQLSTGGSDLETHSSLSNTLVQGLEADHTAVLQRVLQTRSKVRQELANGSVVIVG